MSRTKSADSIKIVKKIPSTENGSLVTCKTISGQLYIVSWCIERMRFTLWHTVEDGYAMIGTAKSPIDLYLDIPWSK